ncbi:hypothetical protein ACLOJK_031487 [Asimina triloba]
MPLFSPVSAPTCVDTRSFFVVGKSLSCFKASKQRASSATPDDDEAAASAAFFAASNNPRSSLSMDNTALIWKISAGNPAKISKRRKRYEKKSSRSKPLDISQEEDQTSRNPRLPGFSALLSPMDWGRVGENQANE